MDIFPFQVSCSGRSVKLADPGGKLAHMIIMTVWCQLLKRRV